MITVRVTLLTRKEARLEIERHHASFSSFLTVYGDLPEYKAYDVMAFLGY